MSTIIIIDSVEEESAVEEILDSIVTAGETVYFLRLSSARGLGPLIQAINPMLNYGVEYTIDCLPENYDASDLAAFAVEVDASRICIGISERTLTGKARIDDATQSILLHDGISGDLVVGEDAIILEELEYGQ
ncbi:hypothetical protein [Halorientalis regularis]|uniref:Uncharacterized protein n=1 Tax=Halorientalis regularis TaxID=660518 RepID=A0A1G7QEM9_9EURY|nr:hypothetical protein [Halorientalis regularis]SDF96993.1 hypothetical protein SAMN05216218_112113 [Halorientalis regularis]